MLHSDQLTKTCMWYWYSLSLHIC